MPVQKARSVFGHVIITNVHVSALREGSPNSDFAADLSRCARCFCR